MDYLINLERFYGPLDLLLYLLEKNQLDIYDIPIALITDQYMEHLAASLERNLDHIGEFLSMASYLLNLKSSMLLPKHRGEQELEDEEDGRLNLVRQLLEYRRFKQAAQEMAAMVQDDGYRVFFRPFGQWEEYRGESLSGNLKALQRVYEHLLQGLEADTIYAIPQGDTRIEETMEAISTYLAERPVNSARELFALARSRRELTVMFLALLELARQRVLRVWQENAGDDIEIEWVGSGHADA